MQNKFLSNLGLIILLNLLVKPIWVLGIDVSVQNTLGPEVYGNYFALINLAFLFTVILDFGLNNYTNRKISSGPESFNSSFIAFSLIKLILSAGFFLIANLTIQLLGFSTEEKSIFRLISFMFMAQYFLLFLRANLAGLQKFRADVIISVVDKTLMIIIVSVLLFSTWLPFGFSIESFILAQIMAYLITALIALIVIFQKQSLSVAMPAKKKLAGILKEALPFGILGFLMLIYFKMDAVMIERMLTEGDLKAGFYAQSYKLLDASLMFAVLFSTLLLPMFSRLIAEHKTVNSLVSVSARLMLVPALILVLVSSFYAHDFLDLLFTSDVTESSRVFPILIAVLLPLGASYIFGTLITAQGDLKFLNKISVLAILINLVGNYFAISYYGILGAAVVTLVTQTVVSLIQFVTCVRRFELAFSKSAVIRAMSFVLIGIVLLSVSKTIDIHWMLKCSIISIAMLILASILRLLNPSHFSKISPDAFEE